MADLRKLVRWKGEDSMAILGQVESRVRGHLDRDRIVGVVVCVVSADPEGTEKLYEPCFSAMPGEAALWAVDKLKRQIVSTFGEATDE